jgi:hypothetical protein
MTSPTAPCPALDDPNLYQNLAMQLNTVMGCGQGEIVQHVL